MSGGGATFIEVRTETWPGGQWPTLVTGITDIRHAWNAEIPKKYAHLSAWFQRNDPVLSVARELLVLGVARQQDLERIDAAVRKEIGQAVKFANASPFPKLESALTHVWPQ